MKRLLLALLILVESAMAGTVSGKIVLPSGKAIAGGTLTFTLSQTGYVSGSFVTAAGSAPCYTTSDGTIVGEPDPLIAPVVTGNLGSGSLASATYYVKYTYYDGTGESLASPETAFFLSATGTLNVALPVLQPSNATGIKVYISSATGTETLQGTATFAAGVSFAQAASLSAGSALPSSNSSTCALAFNDTIIPANTTYSLSVIDSNGAAVPGFPQRYYIQGGNPFNLSTATPTGNTTAYFPQAIVANPSNHGVQSISGPLNLGVYGITGTIVSTGVTDGSIAAAGIVGQFPQSKQTSAQSLTSTVAFNLASVPLTAGDWDVSGNALFSGTSTTGTNQLICISTSNSGCSPFDGSYENESLAAFTSAALAGFSLNTPVFRVSLSGNATYFLIVQANFASGTVFAEGSIRARRVR